MWVGTLAPDVSLTWRDHAACRGADLNLFFPGVGQNKTIPLALAYCSACPVREPCLRYALGFADRELPGIYGGTTEPQRAQLRKRLKIYP